MDIKVTLDLSERFDKALASLAESIRPYQTKQREHTAVLSGLAGGVLDMVAEKPETPFTGLTITPTQVSVTPKQVSVTEPEEPKPAPKRVRKPKEEMPPPAEEPTEGEETSTEGGYKSDTVQRAMTDPDSLTPEDCAEIAREVYKAMEANLSKAQHKAWVEEASGETPARLRDMSPAKAARVLRKAVEDFGDWAW